MSLECGSRELGVVLRHLVAELPHGELLLPLVVGDELLPHHVTPLQRGDDQRVHVADGDAVADVLGHLGEDKGGEVDVVLRGLHGLGRALEDLDVVHHDRDAGVAGLVDERAQRGGASMVHDDPGDAGRDRRLHVGGLLGVVGLRVVVLHGEAGRIGLLLRAPGPLLEVVAGAAVLDQGDLHGPLVEGCGLFGRRGIGSGVGRGLLIGLAVLGAGEKHERGAEGEPTGGLVPH